MTPGAWLFSSAPAVAPATPDFAVDRPDRPSFGASVSRSLGDGITASLRLRNSVDVAGGRERAAVLTFRVPLFAPRDSASPVGATPDIHGWRMPPASAVVVPTPAPEAYGEDQVVGPRLSDALAYAIAFGLADALTPRDRLEAETHLPVALPAFPLPPAVR